MNLKSPMVWTSMSPQCDILLSFNRLYCQQVRHPENSQIIKKEGTLRKKFLEEKMAIASILEALEPLTDSGLERQQSFNTKESKQQVYQSSGLLDHQASSTHSTSTFWCWSWLVSKFIHRIHVCIWQFLNIFCKFKFLQHGSPHVNFLHGILYHPNIVLDRN